MNFLKLLLAILFTNLFIISCKEKTNIEVSDKNIESASARIKNEMLPVNLQTISFTIKGMTCAIGCAKTIQEELSNLNGIQSANVDFDKELAIVSFDKKIQTPEGIKKIVESLSDGNIYKVSNIKITPSTQKK